MVKSHIWDHDDNVPRFRHGKWKEVFDEKEQTYFETPIHEEREPTTTWISVEAVWARLNTYSIFSTADKDVLKVCLLLPLLLYSWFIVKKRMCYG